MNLPKLSNKKIELKMPHIKLPKNYAELKNMLIAKTPTKDDLVFRSLLAGVVILMGILLIILSFLV